MKPYKVIEETETYTVYEYTTLYVWILYIILTLMVFGYVISQPILIQIGGVSMVLFFLLVSLPYMKLGRIQRDAMARGTVEFSGSKWSFSNPLRVKIMKHRPENTEFLKELGKE